MIAITENPAVLYLMSSCYNLKKTVIAIFQSCPQFLRYFEYKENMHLGHFSFFKISQKLQMCPKIVAKVFLSYAKY